MTLSGKYSTYAEGFVTGLKSGQFPISITSHFPRIAFFGSVSNSVFYFSQLTPMNNERLKKKIKPNFFISIFYKMVAYNIYMLMIYANFI